MGLRRTVGAVTPERFRSLMLLVAAMHAYDAAFALMTCDDCGAQWDRDEGETCRWCAEAAERQIEWQRRMLLYPAFAAVDHGPRYDELNEPDRRVWDATRGLTPGGGSATFWAGQLRRAVEVGLVTMHEADLALRRVERWSKAA